jgi:putative acetyltransferase
MRLSASAPYTGEKGADAVLIRVDDLRSPEIAELLAAHVAFCRASSPPESTHVLDLDALRSPEVTFWSAWDGLRLMGCAALKELDPSHGEIKSMHTAARFRGRGVGLRLLERVADEARSRGYRRLSLETGSMQAFAPARALYARFGFAVCEPFGDYRLDPNSVFMTLEIGVRPLSTSVEDKSQRRRKGV